MLSLLPQPGQSRPAPVFLFDERTKAQFRKHHLAANKIGVLPRPRKHPAQTQGCAACANLFYFPTTHCRVGTLHLRTGYYALSLYCPVTVPTTATQDATVDSGVMAPHTKNRSSSHRPKNRAHSSIFARRSCTAAEQSLVPLITHHSPLITAFLIYRAAIRTPHNLLKLKGERQF
jgi:hypothetical protein